MKIINSFLIIIFIVFCYGCKVSRINIEDLKIFAATETFPDDSYLDTVINKRALVIVAHDDDDCVMSGTIAKLNSQGWEIKQLTFTSHISDKTGKKPAEIICLGNEPILLKGNYRIGADTIKMPYIPISYHEISQQYFTKRVSDSISLKINNFKPSVIFTLDNIKGGYGHPDHVFLSQLILDLFNQNKIECQRIYQGVYTDHMEQEILDKWLRPQMAKWGYPYPSDIANKIYNIDGMPEPNTQIDISLSAEIKMKYLMDYPEEARKNLRKFIPYYENFNAQDYFAIFNREFFRVIENPNR